MIAEAKQRINRLMDNGMIAPAPAYAVDLDSPPKPMGGFSFRFTAEGGGGGCFLDTARVNGEMFAIFNGARRYSANAAVLASTLALLALIATVVYTRRR